MGIIKKIFSKKSKKQEGTIFVKPSESSQAESISKSTGANVQVVGGSSSNPVVISTTKNNGGSTSTSSGGGQNIIPQGSIQNQVQQNKNVVARLEGAKRKAQLQNNVQRERELQYAINQAQSNKAQISYQNALRNNIKNLRDSLRNAETREEYKKIREQISDKRKELRASKIGLTNYNQKVFRDLNDIENKLVKNLSQTRDALTQQVNNGTISVQKANELLDKETIRQNKLAEQELIRRNTPTSNREKKFIEKATDKLTKISEKQNLKVQGVTTALAVNKGQLEKLLGLANKGQVSDKDLARIQRLSKERMSLTLSSFTNTFVSRINDAVLGLALLTQLPKFLNTAEGRAILTTQIAQLPKNVKSDLRKFGRLYKTNPEQAGAIAVTEFLFLKGSGAVFKRLGKVSKLTIAELKRLKPKLTKVSGRIVKGTARIEGQPSFKTFPLVTNKNLRDLNKDLLKLVSKPVQKSKLLKLKKEMDSVIKSFLSDKRVSNQLRNKYPSKKNFTIKEIRTINAYPSLRTAIKRRVFAKFKVKVLRNKLPKQKVKEGTIKGVKVSRREFQSFKQAENEFNKLKKVGKFVKKIDSKGGLGKVESLPKRPLTPKDVEFFKIGRKIPSQFLKDVKQVSATSFIKKYSADVPVIKRFGNLKDGYWRVLFESKDFYQNSVSFSLFKKGGKPVGTITFSTLSSKPLTRFRSLPNALKWGTNKQVVFSKLSGKDFVRSLTLQSRGRKITTKEFLSRIRITNQGKFQDILIYTKKIPVATSRKNIKKQFEGAIPVSVTKGKVRRLKQPSIVRFNKRKGIIEFIQQGKTIKLIKVKSVINPVVIDTSRIDTLIRRLDSIKTKTLSKARQLQIKKMKRALMNSKASRSFTIQGKKKVVVSKNKISQINRIERETRVLKESLAGSSITPRIKITKRVQGVKQLKALQKAERNLKKVRTTLLKRNALSVGTRSAIKSALSLVSKLKESQKTKQLSLTAQESKQLQKTIQKSLLKSESKLLARVIRLLEIDFPFLTLTPRASGRIKKRPPILPSTQKKKEKQFKTFSKPVRIYSVIVKKRGRPVILNNRLIERDALNFMALELDNQLLRSSELKPTGKSKIARKLSPKYSGAFEKRKSKLRQYKIRQKKKIAIRGFIEKRKYALDTAGERNQLRKLQRKKKSVRKTKTIKAKKNSPTKNKTIRTKVNRKRK